MNIRGPCSSCGAQLAIDQRYCVECGQRVGPPLALPYLPAVPGQELPAGSGKLMGIALPMPVQMASTFAALALGFGVVVGTALSPELAGIIAAPAPSVVAEAPPETPPASGGGVGGGGGGSPGSTGTSVASSAPVGTSDGGGSGGGGGGGGKKKKKKKPAAEKTSGIVVRANPVAQSYTLSSAGTLYSIHTDSQPQVGDTVEVPTKLLANGTYVETGTRTGQGHTDEALITGTVTYCADLEQPAAPCDGASQTDHYVYAVSNRGSSILVSAPHPATEAPPKVGDAVKVMVKIGAPLDPVTPSTWASDPACTPPYDEETGLPAPPLAPPALSQTSVTKTSTTPVENATVEAVVQTVCPGQSPKLVLSADDIREADRDLIELAVPQGIDLAKLVPGQAVQAALGIENDGTLSLKGIASDQGAGGANDASQRQGSLAGS